MANSSSKMSSISVDLKNRIMFLIGALFVFRVGSHIPVPGVDAVALNRLFESANNGILGMLNMFSGGSLSRFSVFAIGIMPYISASIVMQLATEIIPSLKALKKEGEAGRSYEACLHKALLCRRFSKYSAGFLPFPREKDWNWR